MIVCEVLPGPGLTDKNQNPKDQILRCTTAPGVSHDVIASQWIVAPGGVERRRPHYTSPTWLNEQSLEFEEMGYGWDEEFWYDAETGEEHERTEENPGPPRPTLLQPLTPDAADYVPPGRTQRF